MSGVPTAPLRERVSERVLLRALAGLGCVLVLLLGLEYHVGVSREGRLDQSTTRTTKPAAFPAPRPASALVPDAAAVASSTDAILARPLFTPSRRPAAVAVAGPSEPRLAGIVIGPHGRRAIFAGSGDERGHVVPVGGEAGSWKVLAIDPASVRVSGPDGVRTLRPKRGSGSGDAAGTEAGGGEAAPALPAHPSILDLLRARRGPFPGGNGGFMGAAGADQQAPGR